MTSSSFISFLHSKDIFCPFLSLLVNLGQFLFTSNIRTTLLVEIATIQHGRREFLVVKSSLYWQMAEASFCWQK